MAARTTAEPQKIALLSPEELRRTLLDEGTHALFLIGAGEQAAPQLGLERQGLSERQVRPLAPRSPSPLPDVPTVRRSRSPRPAPSPPWPRCPPRRRRPCHPHR